MIPKKLIGAGISLQLLLIFFSIYTQNRIISLTYATQEAERSCQELKKKIMNLTHELLQLKEAKQLKQYAERDLGMHKARINDIKTVTLAHD